MVLGQTLARITRHSLIAVVLALLIGIVAQAQGPTVRVLAVTHVQAVLEITAPDSGYCTVEVSEEADYSPVVHDVDATLFTSADTDTSRDTTVTDGLRRTVVVGLYGMNVAAAHASNRWRNSGNTANYSRALQAETPHYYRVRCENGTGTATTGSFTTLAWPRGVTRVPSPVPIRSPGVTNYPTYPGDHTTKWIDPITGGPIYQVSLDAYKNGGETHGWPSGGMFPVCQVPLYLGGHLCLLRMDGAIFNLYWISASAGAGPPTVKYLGNAGRGVADEPDDDDEMESLNYLGRSEETLWDTTTGGVFYSIEVTKYVDGNGVRHYALFKFTYTGDLTTGVPFSRDTPQTARTTMENLTKQSENRTLTQLVEAFDATFVPGRYSMTLNSVTGRYVKFYGRRQSQDSYGFLAVYDLQTNDVVAYTEFGRSAQTRWCGMHTILPVVGNFLYLDVAPQNLRGTGSTGPWDTTLTAAITGTGATTISVAGEPACSAGDVNTCYGESAVNDTSLLDAAVGDAFQIDSEQVIITAKNSAMSWDISRGAFGSTPATHSNGATVRAVCKQRPVNDATQFRELLWDFVNDPDGSGDGMYWDDELYDGHFQSAYSSVRGQTVQINGGGNRVGTAPAVFNSAVTSGPEFGAAFAGLETHCHGNNCQKHPSLSHLANTRTSDHEWYLDAFPFVGTSNTLSSINGLVNVTGSLYRYTPLQSFDLKKVDLFGVNYNLPLQYKGGPSVTLSTNDDDNYRYCVAQANGECYASSTAGQVYVNLPSAPTYMQCGAGGENPPTAGNPDLCIGLLSPQQGMVMLFALDDAEDTRNTKQAVSLTASFRNWSVATSARMLPSNDGGLMFMTGMSGASNIVWTRSPSWQTPVMDYSTFVPVTLAIPDAFCDGDCTNVLVKWGYVEYGDPDDYFCTQRQEACVIGSTGTTVNYTTYYWASESYTGMSCASGCSVVVPVVPAQMAYTVIVYRDSGNNVLSTSAPFVLPGLSQIQ